ncbi:hypothetical protein C8F04DRAFT_1253505 [Mycena alexandri]|uniref:F-box domain-containing protein n=1 Tax=Mycena alexandri TaxID=1745969 RepID=A0AAD6X8W8_9AGAR|nr:hypothetical protein C8F04DRAFT_1253505 [Mycena alexandri]
MEDLPVELTSKILRLAVGVFKDQPQRFVVVRDVLCCLSRSLRAIGLGDPQLWSPTYISPRIDRDLIIRRISRTTLPLTVYILIEDDFTDDTFCMWFQTHFAAALSRTTDLSLISSHLPVSIAMMCCLSRMDASALSVLHLDIGLLTDSDHLTGAVLPVPFRAAMPNLARLSTRRTFLFWKGLPAYRGIQELKIYNFPRDYLPPLESLLDVLRSIPTLVRLELRDVNCRWSRNFNLPGPLLPNLTHLAVSRLTSGVIDLLQHTRMPLLGTLRIAFGDSDHVAYMHVAWDVLFTGLTTAIVSIDSCDTNLVGRFLRRMSGLQRLDLRANSLIVAVGFHHMMIMEPQCMPALVNVLLPVSQPPKFIHRYLLHDRFKHPLTHHLVFPAHDGRTDLLEYFRVDGVVVTRPYYGSTDYWNL